MSLVRFRPEAPDAGVAHPVERHLAKVEVASSSLVTRSKQIRNASRSLFHMVPWPSGKARVCKTLIRQFKSGRYLQKRHTPSGVCLFLEFDQDLNSHKSNSPVDCCLQPARWRQHHKFLSNGKKLQTNLAGTCSNAGYLNQVLTTKTTCFGRSFFLLSKFKTHAILISSNRKKGCICIFLNF